MTAVEETEYERKQRGYVKGAVERNEKGENDAIRF